MELPVSTHNASGLSKLGGLLDAESLTLVREGVDPKKRSKVLSYTLCSTLFDFVAFAGLFFGWLRFADPHLNESSFVVYLLGLFAMSLLPILVIGGYSRKTDICSARFLSEHFIASVLSMVAMVAFLSLVMLLDGEMLIGSLYVHGMLVCSSMLLVSVLSKRFLVQHLTKSDDQRYIFVFGANQRAREIYRLHRKKGDRRKIRVFDFDLGNYGKRLISTLHDSPVVEHVPIDRFPDIGQDVDTVVLANDPDTFPVEFLNHVMAVNLVQYKVETARKFISSEHKKIALDGLNSSWFFEGGFRLLENTAYYRTKCVGDFAMAALALAVLSPLLFVVAMAVKLTSNGPVFFTQQRVGVGGVPFKLYKFRTMKVGSEKGHLYTLENDPRITTVGSFLRKTRLDELPQLLNVLKGEMSVVGPRAEWVRCVDGYEANIPFYHYRHLVKPGITGWAQVNYPYGENEKDTIEKLKFDLFYVRHFSLILDFSIFVKTIYVMIGKQGSR